ncbi:hypothetical protein AKO1_013965 [Acrasis kona]|uniref:TPR-like protein n=1 Tax=Acrasis kona TaxID=1008807 RepID=A0AAW2Z2U0_9EUKA
MASSYTDLLLRVDKVGQLGACDLPQTRVFTNLLLEHVLSITQQIKSLEAERGLNYGNSNIEELIKATRDGANVLIELFEKELNNGRILCKQNEYVFERETLEEISKMKTAMKDIRDAVKNSTITRFFNLHSCIFATGNGVISPEDMLNHPRVFHSIGNEQCSGRTELMSRTINQLSNINEAYKLKVIVVQGGIGAGKTNFSISLCRELKNIKLDIRLHLRLKANTDYPTTTQEAMQQVIKTWNVGKMPNSDQKLRALYHSTFAGKSTLLLIEDPSSLRQVIELLPSTASTRRSRCIVVISSRTSLELDLSKLTTGQIDRLENNEIREVQPRTTSTLDILDEQLEYVDSESEDEESELEAEESEGEEEETAKPGKTVNINDDVSKLFGRSNTKQIVSVCLVDDGNGKDQKFTHPKTFYGLYIPLDKLRIEHSEELLQTQNESYTENDNLKSLAVLLDSLPFFLKLCAKTHKNYANTMTIDQLTDTVQASLDSLVNHKHFSRTRKLCHGAFMACYNQWPATLQTFLCKLCVFPNSFNTLDLHKILKSYELTEVIFHLDQLVRLGALQSFEPNRYGLHDLVREMLKSKFEEEEGGAESETLETVREHYFLHYYDRMRRYDLQHEFSGIEYTPGMERYDYELENMKCVLEFMREKPDDHIEAVGRLKYLIRDRIYPLKRAGMYSALMKHSETPECEITDMCRSELYEGFSYVYFDLTDYNRALQHAQNALQVRESFTVMSDDKQDELELLSVLKLQGDIYTNKNQTDLSKKMYEKMISITTRLSHKWQIIQNEMGTTQQDVILDQYLAIALIATARILFQQMDVINGKKYYEKGITILRRIFSNIHPELSESYVRYANLLHSFKNKNLNDQVIELFEEAIRIDSELFQPNSRIMTTRNEQFGLVLLQMGHYAQSLVKLQSAYDGAVSYYGQVDAYIAGICNNLAVALKNTNQPEKAESMYKESLTILQNLYGETDHRVCVAKANLSQALIQLGKTDQAQIVFDDALRNLNSQDVLLGETATVMASMLSSMGEACRVNKDFEKSVNYFEQALTIQRRITTNAENDIEIGKSLASIARLYFDKGDYEQAEPIQLQSMAIIANQYGKKHALYTNAINTLANIKFKLEKYDQAEQLYHEGIQLRSENHEPDANNVSSLMVIATMKEREKRWPEAEKTWNQVLALLKNQPSRDGAKERQTYNALATNLAKQLKFEQAEALYNEVTPIYVQDFGEDSIEYGELMYNNGAVQLQLQKFDDAEGCFASAATIFADKLGEDHDRTQEVTEQLNQIRQLIYERDQARKCCTGCVIC